MTMTERGGIRNALQVGLTAVLFGLVAVIANAWPNEPPAEWGQLAAAAEEEPNRHQDQIW